VTCHRFDPLSSAINAAGMLDVTAEFVYDASQIFFWRIRLRAGINVLN
jgi:hypothetical protein